MGIPEEQRMLRREMVAREHEEEHEAALRRAVSLAVPRAFAPRSDYGTFNHQHAAQPGEESDDDSMKSTPPAG